MSISSAFAAEYSNTMKEEWLAKLQAARDAKDWAAVDALIEEMADFYFSE
jgi:hypothetical protein